jgi:adenylosuccinate lyase
MLVYPEAMQANLDRLGGLVNSQRVLLALTQKGVSREDAYRIVQGNSMEVWQGKGKLRDLLKADPKVTKALSKKELEALFDLDYHLRHVDTIFHRVFGAAADDVPAPKRRTRRASERVSRRRTKR